VSNWLSAALALATAIGGVGMALTVEQTVRPAVAEAA